MIVPFVCLSYYRIDVDDAKVLCARNPSGVVTTNNVLVALVGSTYVATSTAFRTFTGKSTSAWPVLRASALSQQPHARGLRSILLFDLKKAPILSPRPLRPPGARRARSVKDGAVAPPGGLVLD